MSIKKLLFIAIATGFVSTPSLAMKNLSKKKIATMSLAEINKQIKIQKTVIKKLNKEIQKQELKIYKKNSNESENINKQNLTTPLNFITVGVNEIQNICINKNSITLEKNFQKSQFFKKFNIYDYASSENYIHRVIKIATFIDVEKKIYGNTCPLLSAAEKKLKSPFNFGINTFTLKKPYKNFTKKDFKNLQKEVIEGLAHRYKIHFQVKPEYLEWFVRDLLQFITINARCKNILAVKFLNQKICNKKNIVKDRYGNIIPTIVAYLPLIPGTKKEKNKCIRPVIKALTKRYENISEELYNSIKPRFSMQIKDFIFLAQADGDIKAEYKNLVDTKQLPRNLIYTKNYAFFKGYEY